VRQNSHDDDDHQQFDERKTFLIPAQHPFFHGFISPSNKKPQSTDHLSNPFQRRLNFVPLESWGISCLDRVLSPGLCLNPNDCRLQKPLPRASLEGNVIDAKDRPEHRDHDEATMDP